MEGFEGAIGADWALGAEGAMGAEGAEWAEGVKGAEEDEGDAIFILYIVFLCPVVSELEEGCVNTQAAFAFQIKKITTIL